MRDRYECKNCEVRQGDARITSRCPSTRAPHLGGRHQWVRVKSEEGDE